MNKMFELSKSPSKQGHTYIHTHLNTQELGGCICKLQVLSKNVKNIKLFTDSIYQKQQKKMQVFHSFEWGLSVLAVAVQATGVFA